MKKTLVLALAIATLSIPAKGFGVIHHKHHYALVMVHKPKINFLYLEHPELRAVKDFSLEHQNSAAADSGRPRAITQQNYDDMVRDGDLIPFPRKIDCVTADGRLSSQLRVLAPEAIDYITTELAPAFCNAQIGSTTHQPSLVVSSLTRSLPYQRILAKRNLNARGALGDDNPNRRSSHSTGFTFDISAKNLSRAQMEWLGAFLVEEKNNGHLVEAIFEADKDHFHVMVCIPFLITPS
jgi:hypothetical protein